MARWTSRARHLRWVDALVGLVGVWVVVAIALPPLSTDAQLMAALMVFGGLLALPRARQAWRPLSAVVGARVSVELRPGDRAWYIRPGEAQLVLVTGRRGLRVVIAGLDGGATEGITVRRTRALLIPAEPPRRDAR